MDFNTFIKTYQRKEPKRIGKFKQNSPLVSVCVQTYQHESYIVECLESIINQRTDFEYEIVIGEDASIDGTRDLCLEFAERYSEKVKLFLHHRENNILINQNPSGRFNMMYNLFSAKGKYIALIEGDDYWTDLLKLQKQVDLLENNTNLIASHHWQKIAIKRNGIFTEIDSPKNGHGYLSQIVSNVEEIFSNKMRVKTRTIMFRNIIDDNFFPDWFTKVPFGDVPLSFLLGKHGDFGFIDDEMAVYRETETGVSKTGLKELGINKFRAQRFKNWIEIWDYADKCYEYKYHTESLNTVKEFYKIIFSNMPISFITLINLLSFNLFNRRMSINKTLPQTKMILLFYVKKIGGKFKRKFVFK